MDLSSMVKSSTNFKRCETLSATSDGPSLEDPRISLFSHCSRSCGHRKRERGGGGGLVRGEGGSNRLYHYSTDLG